jgi:hypothetical protein
MSQTPNPDGDGPLSLDIRPLTPELMDSLGVVLRGGWGRVVGVCICG